MDAARQEYLWGALEESGLLPDPIDQLQRWLDEAREADVVEPTAMALATVDRDGRPSCRIVLLRDLSSRGLVFYTNYLSRKGEALAAHPFAAATFWWGPLERQVRVEGAVAKLDPDESDRYFASRPIKSRYASAVSQQSVVVPSREVLEAEMAALEARYPEGPPRPENWGGYLLRPERLEFWQGRRARLHDRFLFTRAGEGWGRVRLAP